MGRGWGLGGALEQALEFGLVGVIALLLAFSAIYWLLRVLVGMDVGPFYYLAWPINKPIDMAVNAWWRMGPTPAGRRRRAAELLATARGELAGGGPEAAATALRGALRQMREMDDRRLYCDVLLLLASVHLEGGDREAAGRAAAAAVAAAERSGDDQLEAHALVQQAHLSRQLGDDRQALALVERLRGWDERRRLMTYRHHVAACRLAAEIARARGDDGTPFEALKEAIRLARGQTDYSLAAAVTCDLAELLLASGQAAQAEIAAREAQVLARTVLDAANEARAVAALGSAQGRHGDGEMGR